MLFATLHEKLIGRVRERIRSGEITERGFAKVAGLSQPHLHNVLKGARSFSTEFADRVFAQLGISEFDLFSSTPFKTHTEYTAPSQAPHLPGAAGPLDRLEWDGQPSAFYPIPRRAGLEIASPVWITLGHDPDLFPYFQDGDLALMSRTSEPPEDLENDAIYLVVSGAATLVRGVRFTGSRLYLVTPKTGREPRLWTTLSIGGRNLREVVLGKLIWLNRELRPDPFGIARFTL